MLYLHGIGHFHPETIIDNKFLQELDIGADSDWIVSRVGIEARRSVLSADYILQTKNRTPLEAASASLHTNAQTGAYAAQLALRRAQLEPADLGWVVCGGCSPQTLLPAEACTIAAELGIDAIAFDINSACSSFVMQISLLEKMGASLPDFVLLVNPENTTRTVDYSDRSTASLWGDATTAAIVSSRIPSRVTITASEVASDVKSWRNIILSPGCHFMQNGNAVQAFAIRKMTTLLSSVVPSGTWDRRYFIGHQANLRMLESVTKRAGIPKQMHLFNVDRHGNCGAAGAPSVLSQNWDAFKVGDRAILVVVGAGLTWGTVRLEFTGDRQAPKEITNYG